MRSTSESRVRLGKFLVVGMGLVAAAALAWSVVLATERDRERPPMVPAPQDSPLSLPEPPADATLLPSFPRATDADLLDGVWFILDRPSSRVHRLSTTGEYLGSFGGEGDGPGEFRSGRILVAHADTIVVAVRRGLQRYLPDGTHLGRRDMEAPDDCSLPLLADAVSTDAGLLVAYACASGEELTAVALLDAGRDSWRRAAERRAPSPADAGWKLFADRIVLSEHPHGFLFGHPTDECLTVHGFGGEAIEELCHEWIERVQV